MGVAWSGWKKKSLLRRFYGYKDKNLKITVKKKIRITVACGSLWVIFWEVGKLVCSYKKKKKLKITIRERSV